MPLHVGADSPHSLSECLDALPVDWPIEKKLKEIIMGDRFGAVAGVREAPLRLYSIQGDKACDFMMDVFATFAPSTNAVGKANSQANPDPCKAADALSVMARIAETEPVRVLPFFKRAAASENVYLRCVAVKESPVDELYVPLIESAASDPDSNVRHWAYDWAFKRKHKKYYHIYRKAQADPVFKETYEAQCFLAEAFCDPSTVPFFINCLNHDDNSIMMTAFKFLDQLTDQKNYPKMQMQESCTIDEIEATEVRVRKANLKAIEDAKSKWSLWWKRNCEQYTRQPETSK